MDEITLAIPNKGRLCEETTELLKKAGIRFSAESLSSRTSHENLTLLLARAGDIPKYVESGAVQCGITGNDMVCEEDADIEILCKLGYGKCSIALAVKENFKGGVKKLKGKTIATRLTNTAQKYFDSKKIPVKIMRIEGAAEITPLIGAADGIIDQVQTGKTLKQNRLKILSTILESEACFIANKKFKSNPLIKELQLSFEGIREGKGKKYLMANIPSDKILEEVVEKIPSMESPTILNLAKKGEYAVHVVVEEKKLNRIIRLLKEAGAKDILVLGIEKVVY